MFIHLLLIGYFFLVPTLFPNRTAVGACNNNTLCEGFEEASCRDCQCTNGVVCGGLCFRNLEHTVCRDDVLEPDESMANILKAPLIVSFEFSKRIPLRTWISGNVKFRNAGTTTLTTRLQWETFDLDAVTKDGKEVTAAYPSITLAPGEIESVALRIQGTKRSDDVKLDSIHTAVLSVSALDLSGQEEYRSVYHPYVIDQASAQQCGAYTWNISGVCLGDIFYPSADCITGKGCIDRVSGWNTSIDRFLKAYGEKRVGVLTVDIRESERDLVNAERVQELIGQVDRWYRREAMKITGKQMVTLQGEFLGHFTPNLGSNPFNGVMDIRQFINTKFQRDFSQFDILIFIEPTLFVTELGEAAGEALSSGVIRLKSNQFDATTITHEISHLFGCSDIYERRHLCNYQWHGSLLCAGAWISGEILSAPRASIDTLDRRVIGNCASEMGWGDQDNDSILDLDDPEIADVAPLGFQGIAINDFQVQRGEQVIEFANYHIEISDDGIVFRGRVVDKQSGQPVAAKVYLGLTDNRAEEEACHIDASSFLCNIGSVPQQKMEFRITARVGRFTAEQRYLYKP